MSEARMQRLVSTLAALAIAGPLFAATTTSGDAQTAIGRQQRPLVPRSQARREADRAAHNRPQVYVPGHFAWDSRRGQYSWVAGRWERYDPSHAFVGGGLQFRNGQWTLGPAR
jgi:hypothetical protein